MNETEFRAKLDSIDWDAFADAVKNAPYWHVHADNVCLGVGPSRNSILDGWARASLSRRYRNVATVPLQEARCNSQRGGE